jgi:uncharacterized small protein (DUF1192 family)
MDWDDVRPQPKPTVTAGENLGRMSVADLEERVRALQAEIERVQKEIVSKRAHEAAADAIFKR